MRLVLLCLSSIMLLLPACAKRGPSVAPKRPRTTIGHSRNGDFTLKADVIEALEDGPVILRAAITYHGKHTVILDDQWLELCGDFLVRLSLPKGWVPSNKSGVYPASGVWNPLTFEPGQERWGIVYAHEWFSRIPIGLASLNVSWDLHVHGKPAEELCAEVAVDVQPATPGRVAAFRRRMESWMDQPELAPPDVVDLFRWIYRTRHPGFVPVALRLFEEWDFRYRGNELLDFSYSVSEAPEDVHARLVQLACNPGWKNRVKLFRYWRERGYDDPKAAEKAWAPPPDDYDYQYWPTHRTALPPHIFAKLLTAKNLWTRILTYLTFPARCSPEWKGSLLEDCRQLSRPIPASQLAPLLRDLDNDDFAVREKASTQLLDLGERVEYSLRQALRTDLAPEAKLRVRVILDRIGADKQSPEWKTILQHLSSGDCDRDAAVAILRALAEGNPDAELTKAAVATLNKLTTPD